METAWGIKNSKSYFAIERDSACDVVVVGGGLAGVLTSYFLARAKKKVILLEKDSIGQGVTYLTTAFITQSIDTSLSKLVKMFGEEDARLVWQSGQDAIKEVTEIVQNENIECDFKNVPAYIFVEDEDEYQKLVKEHEVATKLGFKTSLHKEGLPFKNYGYLKIEDQAKFHPLKFIYAVAELAVKAGVTIHEHSEVKNLDGVNQIEVLVANNIKVKATDVVITTHSPFNSPDVLKFKKGKYKSYIIEAETNKTTLEEAIYWDMKNPYNYFRVDKLASGKRMIIGGKDHRAEIPVDPERNFRALEKLLSEIIGVKNYSISKKWYGPILESSDGLPFIGEYKPHYYLATAFSGNGMTYSMISAILFKDLILGSYNPLTRVYDPKRHLSLYSLYRKASDYTAEFFGGLVRNIFVRPS